MSEAGEIYPDTLALARELGLSRWTVSRALNRQPGISAATRARVEAAVAKSGFQPNVHGRGLRGTSSQLVGIALPSLRDPRWMPLASGLGEGLLIRGMQPEFILGVGDTNGDSRAWSHLVSRRVTATFVLGSSWDRPAGDSESPAWRELGQRKVPVIFLEPGWKPEPEGLVSVRSDYRSAAAVVAGHLRAAGHRNIGLRGFDPRNEVRVEAMHAAFQSRGMNCQMTSEVIAPGRRSGPPLRSRHRQNLTGAPPTAIVTSDDLMALRLLSELRAAGQAAPKDCSIIGYGDEPAAALAAPALTTVDPQPGQLVARALELMDELRRDPGGIEAGTLWIAPLLRCRGSVARAPGMA